MTIESIFPNRRTRAWNIAGIVLCSLVLTGCDGAALSKADDGTQATLSAAEKAPTAQVHDSENIEGRLLESVRFLTSDKLEGRGVGTDGLDLAADYIARSFEEIGLNTRLYDGGPFDEFSRTSRLALGSTNGGTLKGPSGREIKLVLNDNFTPLSLSSSGSFDLPLVFAGFGITALNLGYDDYDGLDVRGKAVVILRHEPQANKSDSRFDGTGFTEHAYFVPKIENALAHGAAAVLLCTDQGDTGTASGDEQSATETSPSEADRLLNFRLQVSLSERRIPVLHCKRGVIDEMLRTNGKSLLELEQAIDAGPTPHSFEMESWRIAGEVSVLKKGRSLKNVVAMLDGDGSAGDETIVVGAHYDHLGRGGWGSLAWDVENEIHNGADDNASGTAVLVEAARQLAARRHELRRRVLFIAFTAEEMGLVGSEHYVADPLVPLKQTVAMLNLDMVGRLRKEHLTVSGTGTAAEFSPLVNRLGRKYGFRITQESGGYGPSDHASFYQKGVPVMHFFTGLHADYHRPSDDTETLNIDGMRRITAMLCDSVVELSRAEKRPQLRRTEESELLADESDETVSIAAANATKDSVTTLGIEKGISRASDGYLVIRLESGSPAETAGIRPGDLIVRVGDKPVHNGEDLQAAVSSSPKNRPIPIRIRRGPTELEAEVPR